jgi:hypothetical protein
MAQADSAHTTNAPAPSRPAISVSQANPSIDRINFQSAGAKSKARQLRDLFEAGMDFETALGCLGLTEQAERFRGSWAAWEAAFD